MVRKAGITSLTDRAVVRKAGITSLTDRAMVRKAGITSLTDRAEKPPTSLVISLYFDKTPKF